MMKSQKQKPPKKMTPAEAKAFYKRCSEVIRGKPLKNHGNTLEGWSDIIVKKD